MGIGRPHKTQVRKSKKGYYAITWFEELEEFSGIEEIEKVLQSVLRGGERFWCFYSYNPPASMQSWVNNEALKARPDKLLHKSNYLQAPPEWVGKQFLYEASVMAVYQPRRFRHEYLGEVTGTGGEIFTNLKLRPITNEEISHFDNIKRGLDLGVSIDPMAYMTMHLDTAARKLYIFNEYYARGCPSWTLAEHIKKENPRNRLIVSDIQHETLMSLKSYGINVLPAKKGKVRENGAINI